jgi:hypothetical protein
MCFHLFSEVKYAYPNGKCEGGGDAGGCRCQKQLFSIYEKMIIGFLMVAHLCNIHGDEAEKKCV